MKQKDSSLQRLLNDICSRYNFIYFNFLMQSNRMKMKYAASPPLIIYDCLPCAIYFNQNLIIFCFKLLKNEISQLLCSQRFRLSTHTHTHIFISLLQSQSMNVVENTRKKNEIKSNKVKCNRKDRKQTESRVTLTGHHSTFCYFPFIPEKTTSFFIFVVVSLRCYIYIFRKFITFFVAFVRTAADIYHVRPVRVLITTKLLKMLYFYCCDIRI